MEEKIDRLLSDYQRRLKTVLEILDDYNIQQDEDNIIRIRAKIGCFRTFITELKKLKEDNK